MNGGEESIPSGQANTKAQVTVLIVEDHFWTRYTAAEYFRGSGYRVIEANNADEALNVFASGNRVHVVFSDIQMSGSMDGLALADWIAQRYPDLAERLRGEQLIDVVNRMVTYYPGGWIQRIA